MADDQLELRELCEPDDVIDRWFFMLASVVADLATMEAVFKDALHGDDGPVVHHLYLQRQLGARIVEAWRVVGAIRDDQEIEKFVREARAEANADWLRERFTKDPNGNESLIEKALGEQRHRTVHHAQLNSAELRETIRLAADEATEIERNHKTEREVIEFPEAAITRTIFAGSDGKLDPSLLTERAKLIEEALDNFAKLWTAVLKAQVARKGVDPARLYRIVS